MNSIIVYILMLKTVLMKSQFIWNDADSDVSTDGMEYEMQYFFEAEVGPFNKSHINEFYPTRKPRSVKNAMEETKQYTNNIKDVIAAALNNDKNILFSGSFPGPTIVYPPIGPIVDLVSAAGDKITTDIHTAITTQLAVINTAITTYSTTTSTKAGNAINTGLNNLQYDIGNLFNTVYNTLATSVNTIISTASTTSGTNIGDASAQLLADLQTAFATASTGSQAAVTAMGTATASSVDAAITSSGTALYSQIESILADTTNTDPIMPQLTFLDPTAIQTTITTGAADLSNTITSLINAAQRSMDTIIANSIAGQVTSETTALNVIATDVKAAINTQVTTLLTNLQTTITDDTNAIKTAVDTILTNNLATLTTSVTTALTTIDAQIAKAVNTTSAQTIKDVQAAITADGNIMKTQLRTIFVGP
ncbi:hypothetical protein EDEG_01031 [Edhazardia aedis USNM 41457]|uniref:Uncharacterized protein n=1 Tax=Edhazardia aedis (strain USNM 41457) TaxID=1003232 RepID=J9DAH1_EDHAE|nr:hypothetical protein EDEG_01031 [Edhazardia aedis USNM 41457]|eukprot:EJW04741.1 hypothetical protein EDEG_01031 [Edhazardia aedis USNM 41457]